jgi:hypothetical protein
MVEEGEELDSEMSSANKSKPSGNAAAAAAAAAAVSAAGGST